MNVTLQRILERQHYKIVGNHSGVKICHWLKQKLTNGRACYKEHFYGIENFVFDHETHETVLDFRLLDFAISGFHLS